MENEQTNFLEEFESVKFKSLSDNKEATSNVSKRDSNESASNVRKCSNTVERSADDLSETKNEKVVDEIVFDFFSKVFSTIKRTSLSFLHHSLEVINDKQNFKMFSKGKLVISDDFKFLLAQNQLMLYRYTGIDNKVVVPDYVGNLPVTYISTNAFKKGRFRTTTTLKNLLSSIKQRDIAIKTIDNIRSAYTGITNIQLPCCLLHIPPYLFEHCPNLHQIEIPKSVIRISTNAFESSNLETIYFSNPCTEDMKYVKLSKFCKVYVKKDFLNSYREVIADE